MPHPVLAPRNVAMVTGGASGLGLAAAHRRSSSCGMRVAIADLPGEKLAAAEAELGRAGVAMAVPTDVSRSRRSCATSRRWCATSWARSTC